MIDKDEFGFAAFQARKRISQEKGIDSDGFAKPAKRSKKQVASDARAKRAKHLMGGPPSTAPEPLEPVDSALKTTGTTADKPVESIRKRIARPVKLKPSVAQAVSMPNRTMIRQGNRLHPGYYIVVAWIVLVVQAWLRYR